MTTYLKTTDKVEVQNYPYGYTQKTTAFFSLEHKKGKGFRSVFQTVNPKTGLLNKPKSSTYSPVMLMAKADDGKIKYSSLSFYGDDGMKADIAFMYTHWDLFTNEQIKDIALHILMDFKADIYAKAVYCGSDTAKMLPLYDAAICQVVTIAKTGENHFDKVVIDFEAVKALEIPDYKPFKVVRV